MHNYKIKNKRWIFRLTALITTVSLFSYMQPSYALAGVRKNGEVIVAVIDTGVNIDHELLKDSIWVNNGEIPGNGIDDDHNGYIDDIWGWDFYNNDGSVFHDVSYPDSVLGSKYEDDHGTHVAGLIVSAAGRVGELFKDSDTAHVKIMVLQINGGENSSGSTADAVKAIKYAEANGASICNLSWGSNENDSALMRTIGESGMLFVCCAGNEGTNNDLIPVYPASYEYDNILSVTGAEIGENIILKGNYGRLDVDICADSIERFSALSHGWGYKSGASMATAEVCGTAAALMGVAEITSVNLKNLLIDSSDRIANVTGGTLLGGLMNVEKAVSMISSNIKDPVPDDSVCLLLNYNEITITEAGGFVLRYLALPAGSNANVTYASFDDKIASVSYNGMVIGKAQGDVLICVKNSNGAESSCLVHVR